MTTVFNTSIWSGGSYRGNANESWRQLIQIAAAGSLGQISVTFRSGRTAGWKTTHVSVGIYKPSVQPDVTGPLTELKFSGASGFTIAAANGTVTSDPVEFAFSAGDYLYIVTDNSSDATLVDMARTIYEGGGDIGFSSWQFNRIGASWNEDTVTGFAGPYPSAFGYGIETITTTLGSPPVGTLATTEAPDTFSSYGVSWSASEARHNKQASFFFAWVNEWETEFHSGMERVDEDIFSFNIKHEEGQHPTLDITITNPRIGLLHAGRKVWAWFSWRNPANGHVVPLFFGVLVGVPTDLFQQKITLKFICRSLTYIDDKQAVAETMKIRPYWDPVFLDGTHRDDPDAILEGWSKLWHIDRLTCAVTASDVLEGEDGTAVFGQGDGFYDSLSVKLGQAPLTDLRVEANVTWTQRQENFMTGPSVSISTYTGDSFMSGWPKPGSSLGGGWKVEQSFVVDHYSVALTPMTSSHGSFQSQEKKHINCDTISSNQNTSTPALLSPNPISAVMTGQFVVGWCDPFGDPPTNTPASFATTGIIIPMWSLSCSMQLRYEAKRQFSESLAFDLRANTQAVLTSPSVAQHTELMTISGADVGEPLITYLAWSDFKGRTIGVGQLAFPNNPTTAGGMSYQVCIRGGTCGTVEPDFSDIPGTTIADGTAIWASLGTAPESVIQRMAFATSYGPGTILFYQPQAFDVNTGQLENSGLGSYYLITYPVRTNSEYTKHTYRPKAATSDAAISIAVTVETEDFTPVGMNLGPYPPLLGIPIGGSATNVTARCYFPTARGNWSLEYLLCKARARLRMRARAVTIGWDCPFELATTLSCRMNASISDPRLPGATATGKIVSYELKGENGKFIGHVEIGCPVGYGGSVTTDPGTPEYASPGYMQAGYQRYDNVTIAPTLEEDVSYTPPRFYPFDDGLTFPLTLRQVTNGGIISGDLGSQREAIMAGIQASVLLQNNTAAGSSIIEYTPNRLGYQQTQFASMSDAQWALEEMRRSWTSQAIPAMMASSPISWTMELRNIQNGPFNGSYGVRTSVLEVPQGINLEAASSV